MRPACRFVSPLTVLLALLIPLTAHAGNINADLLKAAEEGKTDVVRSLIAKGADVNTKDTDGRTALMKATQATFVDAGASLRTVMALLEAGADVNTTDNYGNTALMFEGTGNKDIVKALLDKGADPNAISQRGDTALLVAMGAGRLHNTEVDTEVVNELLEKGADVNARNIEGDTALMLAERSGMATIAALLKKAGAKTTEPEIHDLFDAAKHGDLEKVRLFLSKGADVNSRDKVGHAALDWAVQKGHTEVVKELLANGADVNGKIESGSTPLILATMHQQTEVVKVLLENGADVNARSDDGYTALILALFGSPEIAQLLMNAGAKE